MNVVSPGISFGSSRRTKVNLALRTLGFGRIALGALFLVMPEASSRRLLIAHRSTGEALTFGRMTAGRDLALGVGTLLSSFGHSESESEWLLAGLLADSIDFYAFLVDDSFRLGTRVLSGFVAAGAVGIGAWTLKNLDALRRTPDLPEEDREH